MGWMGGGQTTTLDPELLAKLQGMGPTPGSGITTTQGGEPGLPKGFTPLQGGPSAGAIAGGMSQLMRLGQGLLSDPQQPMIQQQPLNPWPLGAPETTIDRWRRIPGLLGP